MFVDRVKIYVKAGNGGHGCTSFLREKYLAKGGPDGGDGGDGGDIILQAKSSQKSLTSLRFQQHQVAKNGTHGQGRQKHGASASNLIIFVPIGTVVMDFDNRVVLADLSDKGEQYIVVKGGKGGKGNKRFVTSTNRAPRYHQEGTKGEEVTLCLELKIIADVALVGYPNAGKSTFLNNISNAKVKTAPYPFTTLTPQLGVVKFANFIDEDLIVADIPGLIDGASKNVGLGHHFLKHIERTHILAFVIDMAAIDGRDPVQDLQKLQQELEIYQKGLSGKAKLIIANKMDDPKALQNFEKLKNNTELPLFPVIAELDEETSDVINFLKQENNKIKATLQKTINLKAINDNQVVKIKLNDVSDDLFDLMID